MLIQYYVLYCTCVVYIIIHELPIGDILSWNVLLVIYIMVQYTNLLSQVPLYNIGVSYNWHIIHILNIYSLVYML